MNEAPTPWHVRALTGLGGWTAAGLLLWFAESLGLSPDAQVVVGVATVTFAIALRRRRSHAFAVQAALALALAGEAIALWGVERLHHHAALTAGAGLVIELALLLLYPDAVMRFLSTVAAGVAGVQLLHELTGLTSLDLPATAAAGLALAAFELSPAALRGRLAEYAPPVGWGACVCLLLCLLTGPARAYAPYSVGPLATLGVAAAALVLAWRVLAPTRRRSLELVGGCVAATAALAAFSSQCPGVVGAIFVGALAFRSKSTALLWVAGGFLLLFGAHFYTQLESTLLAKSAVMALTGLLFLGLRQYLLRRSAELEEAR